MSDEISISVLKQLVLDQKSQIDDLNKKVSAALKQAEAAENYSRQDCFIFRGKLDVRPNHSLRDEMMRLIHYHTGVQFPAWCINVAHWLGGGKSVIIRFNNKAVREQIYRNRVPKDQSKRGLFIHESLTPTKMELVSRCSALRRDGKISTYYTQGGSVFVKKSRERPSIMITPEMSDAEIMVRLERQPASFSQAAARPPTETQSDVTQTQIGLPAPRVQMAPMVGSPLAQSPVAAVPAATDAAVEAVADPSGAGEVGGHPAMEQYPEQLAEGDDVRQGERAADAENLVVSQPVTQAISNKQNQVSGRSVSREGDFDKTVRRDGCILKPKQAGVDKRKECDGKADNQITDVSHTLTSSHSSDSDDECGGTQRVRKVGGDADAEPADPKLKSSTSSGPESQRKSNRKKPQTRNKK